MFTHHSRQCSSIHLLLTSRLVLFRVLCVCVQQIKSKECMQAPTQTFKFYLKLHQLSCYLCISSHSAARCVRSTCDICIPPRSVLHIQFDSRELPPFPHFLATYCATPGCPCLIFLECFHHQTVKRLNSTVMSTLLCVKQISLGMLSAPSQDWSMMSSSSYGSAYVSYTGPYVVATGTKH